MVGCEIQACRDRTISERILYLDTSIDVEMKSNRSLRKKLVRANGIRRKFGCGAMLQHALNVLGGPLCGFEAYALVWLSLDRLKIPLDLPSDTEFRFLTIPEIEAYADDPANEFVPSHLDRARQGNDLCFAGLVNGRLASYGWYALDGAFSVGDHGLLMRGPANAAYMHSGFTHPDFRGRRLHGIGMGRALRTLSYRGIQALVSDVDWANHASLKSCDRLGYQRLGTLFSFGVGHHRIVWTPRDARLLDITIEGVNATDFTTSPSACRVA